MIASVNSTDQDAVNSVTYVLDTGLDDMDNCAFTNFGNPPKINASLDFEAMNTSNIRPLSTGQSKAGHNNVIHIRANNINYVNGTYGGKCHNRMPCYRQTLWTGKIQHLYS